MNAKHEGGLSRWARRKAEASRQTAAAPRSAALPAAAVEAADPAAAAQSDAPPPEPVAARPDPASGPEETPAVAADQLPDLETLDYDSDYSGFLSADIDDAVRNMALRRLWRSNPLLANVDGLVDYDDDFSDAATVIEGMKSIYRVGRGMIQEQEDGEDVPPDTAETETPTPEPKQAETQTDHDKEAAVETGEDNGAVAQSLREADDRETDKSNDAG